MMDTASVSYRENCSDIHSNDREKFGHVMSVENNDTKNGFTDFTTFSWCRNDWNNLQEGSQVRKCLIVVVIILIPPISCSFCVVTCIAFPLCALYVITFFNLTSIHWFTLDTEQFIPIFVYKISPVLISSVRNLNEYILLVSRNLRFQE